MEITSSFLNRLNKGTESAACQLDDLFRERLCRLVRAEMNRKYSPREDPEDVVQSVMGIVHANIARKEFQFRNGGELWSLLQLVARRRILNRVAKYKTITRDMDREQRQADGATPADMATPEEEAIADDLRNWLLAGIDPEEVEICELHLDGHSRKEISERVGRTESAVRVVLDRLKNRCRRLLREDRAP